MRLLEIDTSPGEPLTWPDGSPFTRRDAWLVAVQWVLSVAFVIGMVGLTLANTPSR